MLKFFYAGRFGLCLVADVPVDVDAKTDAAVGITRAFSFIVADKDPRQAFDWLLQVSLYTGTWVLRLLKQGSAKALLACCFK